MNSRTVRFGLAIGALLTATTGLCAQPRAVSLESLITREMEGKAGSVVVVDVVSGKILSAHDLRVAARTVTAPGSTVKPFVLMELLDLHRIDPEKRIFCPRVLTLAGRRMDCTHSPAVKTLDAADAIAYSCNNYFATISAQADASNISQAFVHAGFASSTKLAGEEPEALGRITIAPDTSHRQLQALGDWGIEVTPLELLAAYRKLALRKLKGDIGSAAPVFDGLESSVQYGMAHAAKPSGITAAGKTGTAANSSSPMTHGFFAGYAPADKPEIVLVVFLEQGRGSDAAAVAGSIFTAYAAGKHVRQ